MTQEEKKIYKMVYELLSYIDNDANVDVCVSLINSSPLGSLIVSCQKFCNEIEEKYGFDPDIDKPKWLEAL